MGKSQVLRPTTIPFFWVFSTRIDIIDSISHTHIFQDQWCTVQYILHVFQICPYRGYTGCVMLIHMRSSTLVSCLYIHFGKAFGDKCFFLNFDWKFHIRSWKNQGFALDICRPAAGMITFPFVTWEYFYEGQKVKIATYPITQISSMQLLSIRIPILPSHMHSSA